MLMKEMECLNSVSNREIIEMGHCRLFFIVNKANQNTIMGLH